MYALSPDIMEHATRGFAMMSDKFSDRDQNHFDWPLFIAAALIAVFGVINLYSATSVYQGN